MPITLAHLEDLSEQLDDMRRGLAEIKSLDWTGCRESPQFRQAVTEASEALTKLLTAFEAIALGENRAVPCRSANHWPSEGR